MVPKGIFFILESIPSNEYFEPFGRRRRGQFESRFALIRLWSSNAGSKASYILKASGRKPWLKVSLIFEIEDFKMTPTFSNFDIRIEAKVFDSIRDFLDNNAHKSRMKTASSHIEVTFEPRKRFTITFGRNFSMIKIFRRSFMISREEI